MNFNSLEFALFFPMIVWLYWRIPGRYRWILLLAGSWLFYISTGGWTFLLLFVATGVSYIAAKKIERAKNRRTKKRWLTTALVFCLGCLVLFKYAGFIVENGGIFWHFLGGQKEVRTLKMILPIGISFYTFQTLSYVIDVYRGTVAAEKHFGYYALFVSFFPQLVAGPIERSGSLLLQLKKEQKKNPEDFVTGAWMMANGYFKKLVIADTLSVFVDRVYAVPENGNGPAVLIGTFFFALQIYCDFAGYSEIARGAARMMGIHLMKNFDRPYLAENIREFWRRWHISLTGWLTDYVYKPLGGNRNGTRRTCMNILLVFLASGLWHGAAWTFVIWGLLHGVYMIIGKWMPQRRSTTFLLVCLSWIFFRAASVGDAFTMIKALFTGWNIQGFVEAARLLQICARDVIQIVLSLFCLEMLERKRDRAGMLTGFYMGLVLLAAWLMGMASNGENAFIYFQF